MNPQTLERTDTPVLELQPRPAQPLAEAPQQRSELSVVQYLVQSGASVEQVQAALELQVRADNHKLEMMRELGLTPNDVLCIFDDRQCVVDMWRENGYRVMQVAAWKEQ